MTPPRFAILGNPANRRVEFFQRALASRGHASAHVLSYRDLLGGSRSVADLPANSWVRIESPGEDFAVEKDLLAAGEEAAIREGGPCIRASKLGTLSEDPGRVLFPRQWYLGYCELLQRIQTGFMDRGDLRPLSSPADIEVMFDKELCHRACEAAGVSVPRAIGSVGSFDELVARVESAGMQRIFIKLANSSSASGVVALRLSKGKFEAVTTAEMVAHGPEVRLYNSLQIRRYTRLEDVRVLIDSLAPHRVHVEEWLPKAALSGRVFDVRVVVIAGEPQHLVVRTSRGPITNLHLGNRRGDADALLSALGEYGREELFETCRRVARQFAGSMQMGIDVLFTPGLRQHYVLEVNAFGDLLPRVTHQGKDTYEAQVDAATSRHVEAIALP